MIVFKNNGEIDPRSITTFGVSSKEKEGAIGYFGTGLKYAISILLREGHEITVYSGMSEFVFDIETTKVRVDDFDFITMNGSPISFTTELGKNWELWQAFRELYCNCLDEDGVAFETEGEVVPQQGMTYVVVKGSEFEGIFHNKDKFILDQNTPVIQDKTTKHAYYKTVKVFDSPEPFLLTYNLQSGLTLTEDRTVKSSWDLEYEITKQLSLMTNKQLIKKVVTAPEGWYEHGLNFNRLFTPSVEFEDTVKELYHSKTENVNPSALKLVGIDSYYDLPNESDNLDQLNTKKLNKAVDFCSQLGYNINKYPLIITDKLKASHMGLAKDGKMYINPVCFDKGTKYLAATILEEWMHLEYGFIDITYEFQTHLFDVIMTLGEKLIGEPI